MSFAESFVSQSEVTGEEAKLLKKKEEEILAKIDVLSERYLAMRKRIPLLVVTVLTMCLTMAFVVLIVWFKQRPLKMIVIVQLFLGCLLIVGCALTTVVISMNYPFYKSIKYVSLSMWCVTFAWIIVGSLDSPFTVTVVLAIIIILLYVVLPVPILWAVIGGCVTVVAEGCRHIRHVEDHPIHLKHYVTIINELCCLLAANVFGAYIKCVTDRFHHRTFVQTYEDLKARIVLEEERQCQEQLLLSIIPADLAYQMRQSMLDKLSVSTNSDSNNELSTKQLWHEFYIREHKQVSILFADLVNFTQLTTKCTAKELVTMLNEIYGKFDVLARMNDCMRIKTLGDCYCCVSGMPVSRPQHAENAVKTGLEMIQAIKSIQESTASVLDMRIGIHSGNVLCGVLGMTKWKYDIWSEDVVYANFLESTGVPGKVHISEATKSQLSGAYSFTQVQPAVVDTHDEAHQTYYVTQVISCSSPVEKKIAFQRTKSFTNNSSTQQLCTFLQTWGAPKPFEDLSACNDSKDTIMSRSYDMLEASVDSTFLSKPLKADCRPCLKRQLDSCCFEMRSKPRAHAVCDSSALSLQAESAPLLSLTLLIYFLFIAILNCTIFHSHFSVKIMSIVCIIFVGFVIFFYSERKHNQGRKPRKKYLLIAYYLLLTYTVLIHTSYILITQYIGITLEPNLTNCTSDYTKEIVGRDADLLMISRGGDMLLILPIYLFIYTNTLIKLIINSILLAILIPLLLSRDAMYFLPYKELLRLESHERVIPTLVVAVVCYLFISSVMCLYSKQMENGCQALKEWKTQFSVENLEVEKMKSLTKLLLMNILPQHVASYYFERRLLGELYHESYDNVCIMFATVVNFDQFFHMSSDYNKENQSLRLLNEIIGDFDLLLSKPKFSSIEKMKTVGSTYMAAAGLQTYADAGYGDIVNESTVSTTHQLVKIMVDFAIAFYSVLESINKHSFNNFQLRIGLSHGPVIAGVVGAQKPQYDVWGDTVNMASRMDSEGVADAIQMTENTAAILEAENYPIECRGQITVKGKHKMMTTYLLKPLQHPSVRSASVRESR